MYNINLNKNEKIILISDDTIIFTQNKDYDLTTIITNKRLLLLDYPSKHCNTNEDLRCSKNITYINQKEIILEKDLTDIKNVEKVSDNYKINFIDDSYIIIKDEEIINKLLKINKEY